LTGSRDLVERIWSRDPTVWTGADEARWLGWLGFELAAARPLGPRGALFHSATMRAT